MSVSPIVDCDAEQFDAHCRDKDARKGEKWNEEETHRELEGAEESAVESCSEGGFYQHRFDPNAGFSPSPSVFQEVREGKRKAARACHVQPRHANAKEVRVFDAKGIPTPGLEPGSAR